MTLQEKIQANTLALLNSFNGLNEGQLKFKPAENSWSVLECLEHINLIGEAVFKVLTTPAPAEKTENTKTELFGEEKLTMLLVTNRAFKVPAPDYVMPKGRFNSIAEATQNVTGTIDKIIDLITTSPITQETHTMKHPVLGQMTKTDWAHFLITHTSRHIHQIEGLKQKSDFPV
ncbi:MAG: DinB family protein [Bacteroidota bacterium]